MMNEPTRTYTPNQLRDALADAFDSDHFTLNSLTNIIWQHGTPTTNEEEQQ